MTKSSYHNERLYYIIISKKLFKIIDLINKFIFQHILLKID